MVKKQKWKIFDMIFDLDIKSTNFRKIQNSILFWQASMTFHWTLKLNSKHKWPWNDLKWPYFQAGDRIAFYDNTAIREGNFLCSGHNHNLRKGLISVLTAGPFKGSPAPNHFIFQINVGKSRIRHRTTLKLNFWIQSKSIEDGVI